MSSATTAITSAAGLSAFSPPPSKCIFGAIAGDIIGSVYEHSPTKNPSFQPLFHPECTVTDDTVLTVATMEAVLAPSNDSRSPQAYDYASAYRKWGRRYPRAGYGGTFVDWLKIDDAGPYNSWGNGSAMRCSPIGWAFQDRAEVLKEACQSASVTHNHPEGIKGAQATALAVYLARTGSTKEDIRRDIETTFNYDLSTHTVADIRPGYRFDVSCQGSVPQSILCFLEAESVEDAARLAVSFGGDSDTMACIACGIAEAFYGRLNGAIEMEVRRHLPPDMLEVVERFSNKFGHKDS